MAREIHLGIQRRCFSQDLDPIRSMADSHQSSPHHAACYY